MWIIAEKAPLKQIKENFFCENFVFFFFFLFLCQVFVGRTMKIYINYGKEKVTLVEFAFNGLCYS